MRGDQARQDKDSNINKENSSVLFFPYSKLIWGDFFSGFFFKDKGKRRKGRKIVPHMPTEFAFDFTKIFLKLQLSNKSSPVAKIKRVGWGKFIR